MELKENAGLGCQSKVEYHHRSLSGRFGGGSFG
jgi:hypothetical protein